MKTKNYPRALMPQIRKSHLKSAPHPYKKMNMLVSRIKPAQSERVEGMHDRARKGYSQIKIRPIIVDKDKDEILIFSENYIYNNWNSNNQKYHLLRYILPTEDLDDFNLIKRYSKILESYNFSEIIKKYNFDEYIISIIFKENNTIKVLNKINFDQEEDLKNISFQNLNIDNYKEADKLIESLKSVYENYWKSKNEINTSVKISLTVSINNNINSEISKFEEILNNADLVYNYYIYKFNNKDSFYKIIFNGSPDHFLNFMKNKNYEFDIQNKIWSVK